VDRPPCPRCLLNLRRGTSNTTPVKFLLQTLVKYGTLILPILSVCKCGSPVRSAGQRNCLACHAAYMRQHRPKYSELEPVAKKKAHTRAYAHTYLYRGHLKRQPCEDCGAEKAEMHHEDYDKPLQVRWKCRTCHLKHHGCEDHVGKVQHLTQEMVLVKLALDGTTNVGRSAPETQTHHCRVEGTHLDTQESRHHEQVV